MPDPARPCPVATLEEVQAQFATWRSEPQRTRRIPDELWDAAVSLCSEHSVCKVSRALRLDYNALKERNSKSESAQAPRAFIELGPLWGPGEVLIECYDQRCGQLRIHCKGAFHSGVVDLVKGFFGSRR
jgi:hypothetical protein